MTEIPPGPPQGVGPQRRRASRRPVEFDTGVAAEPTAESAQARIHDRANKRGVWLEATAEVTRQILGNRTQPALDLVVRSVAECAEADVASLVLRADNGEWMMRARAGEFRGYPVGTSMDTGRTLTGRIIRSARAEVGDDFQGHIAGDNSYVAAIGSPILGVAGQVLGVVGVARLPGRPLFTEEDVELLTDFSQQVGAALDLDRTRNAQEATRLGAERDRIAADLHDHVIQELFATAMGLQKVASGLTNQSQQTEVLGYADSLDETIRRIRQIIFTVQTHRWNLDSVQGRLLAVLDQQGDALGFTVEIEFAGPLRLGISDDLAGDIVAVVREGLSNVAKHARAHHARIIVSLVDDIVTVTVTDDGIGVNDRRRDRGLGNLRRRAESRGGRFTVSSPESGGTRLEWTAQVSPDSGG